MNEHHCLLCIGSNTDPTAYLSYARKALYAAFPGIRFGNTMKTEAIGSGFHSPFSNQLAKFSTFLTIDSICKLFKEIEHQSGRTPTDKSIGIVKLDIDLLVYDEIILKPKDMVREYIRIGLMEL